MSTMIALFDSGDGGLHIMKHVLKELPDYDYLYLGDNFRAPYGNYSNEKIKDLSEKAIDYLFDQGAVLIIAACNTISVAALRHLQEKYLRTPNVTDHKILGIVLPTVEAAVKKTKGKVGVIGTRCTIESDVYAIEIHKLNPEIKVTGQACPLLVPLIEEQWHRKPEAKMILKKYLRPIKSHNIDTLILGCTHYPAMSQSIKRIVGPGIEVINSGPIVAKSLKDYLQRHPEIETKLSRGGVRKFETTGDPKRFQKVVSSVMGSQNNHVNHTSF